MFTYFEKLETINLDESEFISADVRMVSDVFSQRKKIK
jgi:hypothetical protein